MLHDTGGDTVLFCSKPAILQPWNVSSLVCLQICLHVQGQPARSAYSLSDVQCSKADALTSSKLQRAEIADPVQQSVCLHSLAYAYT